MLTILLNPTRAMTQCPEAPTFQNFTGAGRVTCPCFASGEQAGAVFQAPAAHYPLEILRVGIGWGSQFGGTPSSLEQAIHIYPAGLPNPGNPMFTLEGPVLNDGAINQFDLEPMSGSILVDSGPFTVTLEFRTGNAGNPFASSVVSDGNGCQTGKNVVLANPGGWSDACALGVSGDWVFFVVYRPCTPALDVTDGERRLSPSTALLPAKPNPFHESTELVISLSEPGAVMLNVHDISGRRVARLLEGILGAGEHRVAWDGRMDDGRLAHSGVYFVLLKDGNRLSRRTILLTR